MLDGLAAVLKELREVDPNDLCDEELADLVVELHKHRCALEAFEARLTRNFDVRRVWAADGARSGAAWLARRTRAPKAECGGRLWLGRCVEDLPVAAGAWAAGEIGAAHVRRLAGVRNCRTAARLREDEPLLVGQAGNL